MKKETIPNSVDPEKKIKGNCELLTHKLEKYSLLKLKNITYKTDSSISI